MTIIVTFHTFVLLISNLITINLLKDLEDKFLIDFEKNQNIAHKICRIYTTDREAHNDLFQEITIQVWKNYSKFRGDSKFSTWMYRVALNTEISLYRKSTIQPMTQYCNDVVYTIHTIYYYYTEGF